MLIQLPEGFRRNLPPRVQDSGRIFRDIIGLEGVFDTKASGAGPEMLRTEMGVIYGFDLESSLATQLCELDAVAVTVSAGAANTTASQTFSFPTLPSGGLAARHRIIQVLLSTDTLANLDGMRLDIQPFGDPTSIRVGFALPADFTLIPGLGTNGTMRGFNGGWGRRELDYTFSVRSGAGGAVAGTLHLLVAMVPPGVEVPE